MAGARLRKAVDYPGSDSDDDAPLAMDEEEQEKLIVELREQDEERNEEFKRIFLAIPLVSTLSYIPALYTSRLLQVKVVSFLAISSLIATAYILIFVPNVKTQPKQGFPLASQSRRPGELEPGPIKRYIVPLNAGLSLLVCMNCVTLKGKAGVYDWFWILCSLPLVVLLVVMVARRFMMLVDVDELERLKYKYKGA